MFKVAFDIYLNFPKNQGGLNCFFSFQQNKIIVGHSVYNDFRALKMSPPFYTVRDTAQCKTLVRLAGLEGQGNGLKKLTEALLGELYASTYFWK